MTSVSVTISSWKYSGGARPSYSSLMVVARNRLEPQVVRFVENCFYKKGIRDNKRRGRGHIKRIYPKRSEVIRIPKEIETTNEENNETITADPEKNIPVEVIQKNDEKEQYETKSTITKKRIPKKELEENQISEQNVCKTKKINSVTDQENENKYDIFKQIITKALDKTASKQPEEIKTEEINLKLNVEDKAPTKLENDKSIIELLSKEAMSKNQNSQEKIDTNKVIKSEEDETKNITIMVGTPNPTLEDGMEEDGEILTVFNDQDKVFQKLLVEEQEEGELQFYKMGPQGKRQKK